MSEKAPAEIGISKEIYRRLNFWEHAYGRFITANLSSSGNGAMTILLPVNMQLLHWSPFTEKNFTLERKKTNLN